MKHISVCLLLKRLNFTNGIPGIGTAEVVEVVPPCSIKTDTVLIHSSGRHYFMVFAASIGHPEGRAHPDGSAVDPRPMTFVILVRGTDPKLVVNQV